jgi:rifampicin phosphotransferase
MRNIIWFADTDATQIELTGGKGANLARLTADGFNVPPGFVVSTAAYASFVCCVQPIIDGLLSGVDFADPAAVETATAKIRETILDAEIPEQIAADLRDAYRLLGLDGFVAVRSSGTAEDLADASFAGLHDTFLDVHGGEEVVRAVKRCWASMWTARATSYRQDKGFAHNQARIAVVVQSMVESEVAGVLFTANPLTSATDEFVINASWGLGEAVVSGLVNPDEFTVAASDGQVLEKHLGSKAVRFVRDPALRTGTVQQESDAPDREIFCLTNAQVGALATLGRQVLDYYDGIPQDIEWGYAEDAFYLLQSRPITGVDFSWDTDVDTWQIHEFDRDTVWTRAWADSNWTGAKTPMFYSLRAYSMTHGETATNQRRGLNKTAARPYLRYYKAEVYYNCDLDREVVVATTPKMFRPLLPDLNFIPPSWQEGVLNAEFDIVAWLKMQARIALLGGEHAPHNCMNACRAYIADTSWHPSNLPNLTALSDNELKQMIRRFNEAEAQYCDDVWFLFLQHARDALCLLPILLQKWYPDDPLIVHDLLAGNTSPSRTLMDNAALWRLAEQIRHSPTLRRAFDKHQDSEFFEALETFDEGGVFLADYAEFLYDSGFRGHADRDMIFPRRVEDPSIDYRNFRSLLSVQSPVRPEDREAAVNTRREAAVVRVAAALQQQPFGSLKADGFKALIAYIHEFIVLRDNQRWSLDRLTLSTKMVIEELARRGRARGLLAGDQDHYFLAKDEFYELLDGRASMPLVRAKIAARRSNWQRNENKVADLPLFMQYGRPADLAIAASASLGAGPLQGIPTSRGSVTGKARIVRTQKEIGTVQSGEILICNSTDPGWTPVFMVVNGVVTETGGMLSHASCLSREYGLPSVQIADAMQLIPDGATITIHGDTGQVVINDQDSDDESSDPTIRAVASLAGSGG